MAFYDTPGVTYDSGVLYDEPSGPQPQRARMDKIKLNVTKLSPEQLVSLANNIKTAMTGNANYTTPNPSLASLGTLITTAQTKIAAQVTAANAAKLATSDRDAASTALGDALKTLASYVENTSGGDKVKIESAGFEVRGPSSSIGDLTQVLNLAVSEGDNDGELDAQWDRVYGAKHYEVQTSVDPITAGSWVLKMSASKTRCTISGLTSGQRMWVRIRAIGAAGPGPWSDPSVKIVP